MRLWLAAGAFANGLFVLFFLLRREALEDVLAWYAARIIASSVTRCAWASSLVALVPSRLRPFFREGVLLLRTHVIFIIFFRLNHLGPVSRVRRSPRAFGVFSERYYLYVASDRARLLKIG